MNCDGDAKVVHRRGESTVFLQDPLSPLEMEVESGERPQQLLCYRAGVEIGD